MSLSLDPVPHPLDHLAERGRDGDPALVLRREALSFKALRTRIGQLASWLADQMHEPGARVASWAAKGELTCLLPLAAARAGLVHVPINPLLKRAQVAHILADSGARLLIGTKARLDSLEADDAPQGCVVLEEKTAIEASRECPVRGPSSADPQALVAILYTSGSTGRPKGVMLSHANLAWNNLAHLVEFGFQRDDHGLACGPLYHVGALDLTTTTLIAAGATTIVHRTFDAAAVVDELERSRVTTVWLAPAMVNAIMALPDVDQRDLSSVRVIINGGEKMPIPLIERIQRTFPSAWFADAYGLTETVSGDTFLDRDSIITKLGSVGRPCLHLELDVWDEQGRSVAPGDRGEVVLRGPKVFRGYWRDPRRRSGPSLAAGSTPATSACGMTTATCGSSIASRT